ncbi:MAG: glycosyl transferase [Algoriphagus sp.]|nr:glycosyl transferase [Algoriphagus sp.]
MKMSKSGKVVIICIAYNHEDWIKESLESVAMQDYYNKELLIIDNGSKDQTKKKIQEWVAQYTGLFLVNTLYLDESKPYCALFNKVLFQTDAEYVVDLAGDDVFYPDHISNSIRELEKDPHAAFVFSDAYILEPGGAIHTFYKRNNFGELSEVIELGIIYETLLQRSFICAPTVVFNAAILKKEGGYDPDLYYEDFDIQLRLARKYNLVFSDHIGVLKRKLYNSMSGNQYQRYGSKMLPSTLKVCEKALEMNRTPSENKALGKRLQYELKHALWSGNFQVAEGLVQLGNKTGLKTPIFSIYKLWTKVKLDLSWLYARAT